MLTVLLHDPDENISQRAANALLSQPVESFLAALARPDAAPQLFPYCAEELAAKPGVADALARNRRCPAEVLVRVAPRLSTSAVQALLDNVERLSDAPELAAALAESPSVTIEQRAVLQDLLKADADEAALAESVAAAEPDASKRETLLQRLAKMRVVERIKLALTGGQGERMALIRDPNKMVQRAVLQSPRLTEREVEGFSAMASLTDEILRLIAGNRAFVKNYVVVKNLVNNPKTPLDVSLHLMPRLNATDMKFLTMNKNVPETLRTMAMKQIRQKSQAKPGGGG
jgi:hypothetical protein